MSSISWTIIMQIIFTSLQTDNHACQYRTTQFLQAGCPSCCQTNSVEVLEATPDNIFGGKIYRGTNHKKLMERCVWRLSDVDTVQSRCVWRLCLTEWSGLIASTRTYSTRRRLSVIIEHSSLSDCYHLMPSSPFKTTATTLQVLRDNFIYYITWGAPI